MTERILLRNTQPLLGDRLMFTPVVRDFKKAYPDIALGVFSAGPEIWDNNPHIDRSITEQNADVIYDIGPGKVTRGSKTNGIHITRAFAESLQENSGKKIPQGPFKPDIYLSQAEKDHKIIDGNYWVINTDTGPFTAKRWRQERWQQLVRSMPEITFVQVGLAKDNYGRLTGDNVIDMVNRTKIRELFSLVYNASGCISLVSSLMHVAAAFDKPCVVLAGGREPFTFEKYANHAYIDRTGTLACCRLKACWHNALGACKNHDGQVARCMDMISVDQVREAVESYYDGGVIDRTTEAGAAREKKLLRIVSKTTYLGGAERSVIEIARMYIEKGWRVELAPAGDIAPDIRAALPTGIRVSNHISRPCDVLLLYASDMVFNFNSPQFDVFSRLQAKRKVMALTYKIGKAGEVPWTKGWDKYLFLSTSLRDGFLKKSQISDLKSQITSVLAPAVCLDPFLRVQPDYSGGLRIVRHSSQGDKKFPPDLPAIMGQCKAKFFFMPGPSWLAPAVNIIKYPYQDSPEQVADFLGKGNLYWYLLPAGYTDQGPRTIVEAMAAGLAVICEDRDGPADRVTSETGWKIDSHAEAVDLINSLTPEIIAQKGHAARQRAKSEFVKEKWFDAITGD